MSDIQMAVTALNEKYHTRNPFLLCDHLDILRITCPLPLQIRGFFQTYDGVRIIYLNSALSRVQQALTCAHELGHAVLHGEKRGLFVRPESRTMTGQLEYEAELFAHYLLLGDDFSPQELARMEAEKEPLSALISAMENLQRLIG
ncbi:ImmA/IrrE family metallo-endopeptidase [Oscillospiraceae bacterium OttesenSCG-928-F05]|nr:ImmA/IrrE family metallo-endopeptidase [Oscillospiraceae bacterium OttesenSCG-928-F05]